MKSAMNAREMKAMTRLSEALKAKVKAKRATESARADLKEWERRVKRVLLEFESQRKEIRNRIARADVALTEAGADVEQALASTKNESLTL